MTRVFIAGIATETNTFAPFLTSRKDFEEYGVTRDSSRNTRNPMAGVLRAFRERSEADGAEVVESIGAFAQPAGATVRAVYEELRDDMLADLAAAGSLDMVLLGLHGAMVAQGYDDCEGDMITRVRALAPAAIIGVVLDPHCHLTETMVAGADVIAIVKEYPHIDFVDRAHDVYTLCRRIALGEIAPVAALIDLKLVGMYPTFEGPMTDFVAEMRAAEGIDGVLSVSLAHGFPWADTADVGSRVLVYADRDTGVASTVAQRFARQFYDLREVLAPQNPDIETSLDRAKGFNGQTVLGDMADNPGGGAPGDSTFMLQALLKRDAEHVAIGAFWDPLVAQVCSDAGVGGMIDIRLGGKCGPASGDPVDLRVEVMGVREDHSQGAFGQRQPMGRSVWVRHRGIDIVVCSIRTQVFEPDAFTGLGMDLTEKRLIVVKSSFHYQAGFQAGSDHLWSVLTPGAMSMDFASFAYTKRDPVYFPRVRDPWAQTGIPQVETFARSR